MDYFACPEAVRTTGVTMGLAVFYIIIMSYHMAHESLASSIFTRLYSDPCKFGQ